MPNQYLSRGRVGQYDFACTLITRWLSMTSSNKHAAHLAGWMRDDCSRGGGGRGRGHPGADRLCQPDPVPLMRYDYRHTLTLTTNWPTLSVNNAFTILPSDLPMLIILELLVPSSKLRWVSLFFCCIIHNFTHLANF